MTQNPDRFFLNDTEFITAQSLHQATEEAHFNYTTKYSLMQENHNLLSRYLPKKNPALGEIVNKIWSNSFPTPAFSRRPTPKFEDLTSSTHDSTSVTDTQSVDEVVQSTKFEENNPVHYSLILPRDDKRSKVINLLVGVFAKRLLETQGFALGDYNLFQASLKHTIELLAHNWDSVKYQQADSLAVSVLLSVVIDSNIKQKLVLDTLKSLPSDDSLRSYTKLSSIKKSKPYSMLRNILKRKI